LKITIVKPCFFISPFSSTVIALGLIIVEVIINMIWLIVEPPTTDYLVDRGKNILVCVGVDVRCQQCDRIGHISAVRAHFSVFGRLFSSKIAQNSSK
jgi:hypothetical protein